MSNPDQIIVRTLLLEGGDKMGVGGEIFAEGESSYVLILWKTELTRCVGKLGWVQNLKEALAK